jgi:RNA polymerase-binding transcription factor DksA
MNQEIINKIKADLLERKTQLEKELSDFTSNDDTNSGHRVAQMPEYGSESDENAQEVEQYTTNLAADKVLEKTLADINGALKSIEEGNYGLCKYCGKEIEEKRLLIRPFSSSCVTCKLNLQKK